MFYNVANIDTQQSEMSRNTFSWEMFNPDFISKILGVKYALVEAPSGFQSLATNNVQPCSLKLLEVIFIGFMSL